MTGDKRDSRVISVSGRFQGDEGKCIIPALSIECDYPFDGTETACGNFRFLGLGAVLFLLVVLIPHDQHGYRSITSPANGVDDRLFAPVGYDTPVTLG